ncbi:unnamed protein product, partial [Prorocentrum cordatum]
GCNDGATAIADALREAAEQPLSEPVNGGVSLIRVNDRCMYIQWTSVRESMGRQAFALVGPAAGQLTEAFALVGPAAGQLTEAFALVGPATVQLTEAFALVGPATGRLTEAFALVGPPRAS